MMKTYLSMLVATGMIATAAAGVAGCGKAVGKSESRLTPQEDPPPVLGGCSESLGWRFTQPAPTSNRAVDLLFVTDTSASLKAERERIASTIPEFLARLSPDADLRIGVMPAHGGKSRLSGRLHSAGGSPKVIRASEQALDVTQRQLKATLKLAPDDQDEANGEAGMYSFNRSFTGSRLNETRNLGFYRDEAALAVVFVTDENDICFSPQDHGYTLFPDYVVSYGSQEEFAFQKYCGPAVTPETVIAAARGYKINGKLAFAGIVHSDPSRVPPAVDRSEDAIGHGILQLVRSTLNGTILEIADSDYSAGLSRLAAVVETQLNLQLMFDLGDATLEIDPASIRVHVDNRIVRAKFDPVLRTVEIAAADAGSAGSTISVLACAAR